MEVEDKPTEPDAIDESQVETPEESHEPLDATSIDDLFEAGDEDAGSDAVSTLTLDELNEFAGRKGDNSFKSKEDFFKHYDNLKRFVGVKQDQVKPKTEESPKGNFVSREELDAYFTEREFIASNPTAKEHLDILKAVAKDKGVTIDKAFETLKDTLEAASAFKKERTVGVSSKSRINPMQSTRVKNLAESAKQGNAQAQDALIEEMMGK